MPEGSDGTFDNDGLAAEDTSAPALVVVAPGPADQRIIVDAIKQWFQQHEGRLLLFDNVEDVTAVSVLRPTVAMDIFSSPLVRRRPGPSLLLAR
jgi:hypothetical protein